MIYGVGTDIVAVHRIEEALARNGDAFARRILAPQERPEFEASSTRARLLARRFAAKEAFFKAFGTGMRGVATWHSVHVVHDELGKPSFGFSDAMQVQLERLAIRSHHLSISDEREMACAFVILER